MSEILSDKDKELVAAATQAIKARYRNDWQEVGAAIRTRDGRVVTGVNLDAYVGRGAVCAEAVAIGRALTEKGDQGIETIVAVRHPKPDEANREIAVVSPCGTCRELIHDYDARARVIVPGNGDTAVVTIGEEMLHLDSALQKQQTFEVAKGPMGVAFHPDGHTALVANHGSGRITVVDLAAGKALRDLEAGKGVETLAFY